MELESKEDNKNYNQKVLTKMRVFSKTTPPNQPGFSDSKVLGHFTLDEVNLDEVPILSKLVDNYKKLRGSVLSSGKSTFDHHEHAETRQKQFFTWIENYYKVSEGGNSHHIMPDIICSAGLLSYLLSTPLQPAYKWDFYAQRIGKSVLMWTEPKSENTRYLNLNAQPGYRFEGLVTGQDYKEICYDKKWIVYRREFGGFNLLVVNDIDAADLDGSWVKVKLFLKKLDMNLNFKTRTSLGLFDEMLNLWSQVIVGDCKKTLIGVRGVKKNKTNKRKLEHIFSQTVPELESELGLTEADKNVCYDFLFRLLRFVIIQTKCKSKRMKSGSLQFRCVNETVVSDPALVDTANLARRIELVHVDGVPEWFEKHSCIFEKKK